MQDGLCMDTVGFQEIDERTRSCLETTIHAVPSQCFDSAKDPPVMPHMPQSDSHQPQGNHSSSHRVQCQARQESPSHKNQPIMPKPVVQVSSHFRAARSKHAIDAGQRPPVPVSHHSIPFLANSIFLAASPCFQPPLLTQIALPSPSSTLSSTAGNGQGQWCGKCTQARVPGQR